MACYIDRAHNAMRSGITHAHGDTTMHAFYSQDPAIDAMVMEELSQEVEDMIIDAYARELEDEDESEEFDDRDDVFDWGMWDEADEFN